MQGAPHFSLPRQGVDELMQLDGDLDMGQRLTVIVEQFQVGDETERVGHGDDACLNLDPVPSHPRRLPRVRIAPERLAGAGRLVVAKTQHPGAQVRQVQLRGKAGLPQ